VVKGYAQKEGVDFNEIFSIQTVWVLYGQCGQCVLHWIYILVAWFYDNNLVILLLKMRINAKMEPRFSIAVHPLKPLMNKVQSKFNDRDLTEKYAAQDLG